MNNDDKDIAEFYGDAELSRNRVGAILEAGHYAAGVRKWRRVAIASSLSLAVFVVLSGWLYLRGERFRTLLADSPQMGSDAVQNESEEVDGGDESTRSRESSSMNEIPQYQFIAIRSHDDRCPHCRATGELYATMQKELGNESIEFDQYELQDRATLTTVMKKIEERELTSLVKDQPETAFAVLLSPGGRLLQQFRPSSGVDAIKSAVTQIVEQ